MKPFTYERATTPAEAAAAAARTPGAKFIAGGTNLLDLMKLQIETPVHLIDVNTLKLDTIEGLGTPERLHPLQAAFIEHDGYQCGYCTPGQICSAVGMLEEVKKGWASHVSDSLDDVEFTDEEISERMSGNICRCSAYPNIVDAIREGGEAEKVGTRA